MYSSWLVVIPPILVLLLAFVTHRVLFSLFVGIISATMIFHDFSIVPAIKTAVIRFLETIQIGNIVSLSLFLKSSTLLIFLFLLILGVIIVIISETGGTEAYGDFIQKRSKDSRDAETSTLFLSLLFFIDDYLNVITVGSIMPKITDKFRVPRIKIAFFVNAFAASLCLLVPFSSWGAYILTQLSQYGIGEKALSDTLIISSPLRFFIKMIPFALYSFIIILTTFFIVRRKISFGTMCEHEKVAQKTGNVFGGKTEVVVQEKKTSHNSSIFDFLFPILLLVSTIFLGLFITNYFAALALFFGGSVTLVTILVYFLLRKRLSVSKLMPIFVEGVKSMIPTLLVISMALTFGEILTSDLLTGKFIATKLISTISITLLPLLLFVITTLTSLGTGSAWGAMGVIIPIALPMIVSLQSVVPPISLQAIPIAIPAISAVLAGSVAGINLSPIADLVVMASRCTQSYHIDHVKAQQLYMVPVFIASCVAFLCSGLFISMPFFVNAILSLSVGLLVSLTIVSLLNVWKKKC